MLFVSSNNTPVPAKGCRVRVTRSAHGRQDLNRDVQADGNSRVCSPRETGAYLFPFIGRQNSTTQTLLTPDLPFLKRKRA